MSESESPILKSKKYELSNPWPDLIVAMLSVNNYPLSKTFGLFEPLSASGLFDPANYLSWGNDEIGRRLESAGYDRGSSMTQLFVERLASIRLLAEDIQKSQRILSTGSRQEVTALLTRVKGVGPKVLDSFFLLRGNVSTTRR